MTQFSVTVLDKTFCGIHRQQKPTLACRKLTFQRKSSYLLCFAAVKDKEGSLIKSETAFVFLIFTRVSQQNIFLNINRGAFVVDTFIFWKCYSIFTIKKCASLCYYCVLFTIDKL